MADPAHRRRVMIAATSTVGLLAAVMVVAVLATSSTAPHVPNPTPAARLASGALPVLVGGLEKVQPIQPGFLGLSLEFDAIERYAGTDPRALDPVLVRLIRNLSAGQRPVIRIGGDTTDWTWWPVPGMERPGGVRITLNKRWLSVTRALAQTLNARLILGVNLEANSRAIAGTEARAFVAGIGRRYIEGLEPGNEPELYPTFTWYRAADGSKVKGRPRGYDLAAFTRDFIGMERVLPGPIAGPAVGAPKWLRRLATFLAGGAHVNLVTVHRYPLQRCYLAPRKPAFPTISHLLAARATMGMAESVAADVALAHARGLSLRIDEMNTISCGAARGVAYSFASALWAVDALFAMASVGVDGVNMHSFPRSSCPLFSFRRDDGTWEARVDPEYYGLELFAQAAPPGSRLLRLFGAGTAVVKTWATRGADGRTRVLLINESAGRPAIIALRAAAAAPAALERLRAPSLKAQGGITLGGASFGAMSPTGRLAPSQTKIEPAGGYYTIRVAPASAALVTRP